MYLCSLCGYTDIDVMEIFKNLKNGENLNFWPCEICGLELIYKNNNSECILGFINFDTHTPDLKKFDIDLFEHGKEKLLDAIKGKSIAVNDFDEFYKRISDFSDESRKLAESLMTTHIKTDEAVTGNVL